MGGRLPTRGPAAAASNSKVHAVRTETGDIAATSTVEIAITWPDPLPDLNYTITAVLEHTASPTDLDCSIRARTLTGATIAVRNTALGTRSATVHATAVSDGA